jgi:glycerophosphoryl diester phosphodiesterase
MLKIGHRGACGYEPENTLRSFAKALELGVDIVELDVHVCASGELVVIHDDTVDRTTNGIGRVADKTLAELQTLDAGKGEKVPTLREVLDVVNRQCQVNVELKGKDTATLVAKLVDEYVNEHGWQHDDFLVSSFNYKALEKCKELSSHTRMSVLLEEEPSDFHRFIEKFNVYSVNPSLDFVNQEFVNDAHSHNQRVFVWTVNEPHDIERMKKLGVDGVFSNFPNLL